MSAADRGTLLDRGYAQLSVRRQCLPAWAGTLGRLPGETGA